MGRVCPAGKVLDVEHTNEGSIEKNPQSRPTHVDDGGGLTPGARVDEERCVGIPRAVLLSWMTLAIPKVKISRDSVSVEVEVAHAHLCGKAAEEDWEMCGAGAIRC